MLKSLKDISLEKILSTVAIAISPLALAGVVTLGAYVYVFYPDIKYKFSAKPYLHSYGNNWVSFKDNYAIEMEAFVESNKHKIKLSPFQKAETEYAFSIPEEVLKLKEFRIYSIDQDGNKSELKTFYIADGVILDIPPKRTLQN